MDAEKFLIENIINEKNYDKIVEENPSIDRPFLSNLYKTSLQERDVMRRSRQAFNGKKNLKDFKFRTDDNGLEFHLWYKDKPRRCYYCGIEEEKLRVIFDYENPSDKTLSTARGRGSRLELERKDTNTNDYSEKNCELSCYMCNNHKSDLISEPDFREYFAEDVKKYLDDKYNEIKK